MKNNKEIKYVNWNILEIISLLADKITPFEYNFDSDAPVSSNKLHCYVVYYKKIKVKIVNREKKHKIVVVNLFTDHTIAKMTQHTL